MPGRHCRRECHGHEGGRAPATRYRGASVTDEWEQLVKFAAKRQGTTFADFIVDVTRTAALAIVKHKRQDTPDDTAADAEGGPEVSSTLPVRIEDVAASLYDQFAKFAPSRMSGWPGSSGRRGLAGGDGSVDGSVASFEAYRRRQVLGYTRWTKRRSGGTLGGSVARHGLSRLPYP